MTGLILLLSGGRRHDGRDDCLVHLESVSEMLGNLRRNRAGCEQFTKRPVAVADLTIAEEADKLGPTYPERSGMVKDEPA